MFVLKFMEIEAECKKCRGTRRIREKDGTIHVCYECLAKGKMDQHEKNPKTAEDFRMKL